jgi:hypothetical protein
MYLGIGFLGRFRKPRPAYSSMALVISPSFDPVAIPVVRLVAEDAQWRTSREREMPSMPWYVLIDYE